MSLEFDEVMEFTRGVSGPAAFEDDECRAYFGHLMTLPKRSTIVEVGLQFGRSSSIAARVAQYKEGTYIGIDPFIEPPEAGPEWMRMMQRLGVNFMLLKMTSFDASKLRFGIFPNAILIDGDHTREGVWTDLLSWHDAVEPGGLMMFHDYGRASLPDVYPTVSGFFDRHLGWKEVEVAGTLGVWRKEIRD